MGTPRPDRRCCHHSINFKASVATPARHYTQGCALVDAQNRRRDTASPGQSRLRTWSVGNPERTVRNGVHTDKGTCSFCFSSTTASLAKSDQLESLKLFEAAPDESYSFSCASRQETATSSLVVASLLVAALWLISSCIIW